MAGLGKRGRRVVATTILGSSMAFIDSTVVNVALPAIQAELGASVSGLQWVVESYALVLASLLLVGGALGDRLGRRRIFVLGTGLFAVSSLACGAAPSLDVLLIARTVQGAAGALLTPNSLAITSASFDEQTRGTAIGAWSGWGAITTAVGPLLGGWLVDHASWRWAFLINVPIGAAVIVLALRNVEESRDPLASRLDVRGAALATLCLAGFVFGLVESNGRGFGDPLVVASLFGAVVAGAGFVLREKRCPTPMVPPGLFRSRTFTGANLLTLFLYAGLAGVLFFFPLAFIQVHGHSATFAGAATLPLVGSMFLLSTWAGGLVARVGPRPPLIAGPLVAGIGFALFALPGIGGSYWLTFFPPMLVLGIGMSITVAPLTTTVMSAAEQREAGIASGVNNAVARLAAVLAIAVLGVLAVQAFESSLAPRLERFSPEVREVVAPQATKLAGIELPDALPAAERAELRRAIDESFVQAYRLVSVVTAALAWLASLVAWRTIRR